jgi:cell division protein FtsA
MLNSPPIAALEIGTTKVRVVVGESCDDGQIMITGLGETRSRGVRKAHIVDFDLAIACVRRALELADDNGPVKINEVHLVLSGGNIQSAVSRGIVHVEDSGEILQEHVNQCMENARGMAIPAERTKMHTICQRFYVDDHHAVHNPMGMEGSRVAVDMLLLHGIRGRMRDVVKVVREVPLELSDVAFGGLCSALAVLSAEQKGKGAIVIDFGGGTTDYVVYARNAIAWAGSLAVGGDHVSNDVAHGLRISSHQAEQLKEGFGSATIDYSVRSQKVAVPSDVGTTDRFVPLIDLHTIIHVRIEEMLNLIREEIEAMHLMDLIGAGVVIVGGGARLAGLEKLTSNVFGMPCSVGRPKNMSGLAAVTESPEYAATLGMIRYGFNMAKKDEGAPGLRGLLPKIFGR